MAKNPLPWRKRVWIIGGLAGAIALSCIVCLVLTVRWATTPEAKATSTAFTIRRTLTAQAPTPTATATRTLIPTKTPKPTRTAIPTKTPRPSSTPRPTHTPAPSATTTITLTPSPTATATPETNIGRWYRQGNYGLRVNEFKTHGPFGIWRPEAGYTFLSVNVTYKHLGDSGEITTSSWDFEVRTNEGIVHGTGLDALDPVLPSVGLMPGAEKGGWVTFEVEATATGFTLIWSPMVFGEDVEIPLR